MKICVFGLWHLGSVTAAGLAKSGHTVIGLDFNQDVIENLQKDSVPVSETGLPELIHEMRIKKALSFTHDPTEAVPYADVLWITFDTPVDDNDTADVAYIENAFNRVAPYIPDGIRIIISSQVPVGFTHHLHEKFISKYPDKKVYFAYSPENLRLGRALEVFLKPDRIVIGIQKEEQVQFHPVFAPISDRLEWMSIESAEMTKHAINAFLATSICFANEIAALCEHMGANAKEVERGLKTEERIGPKAYLNPGNAFSGGTLARDVQFLQKIGRQNNLPMHLINSVLDSNDFHKKWVQRKCEETLGGLKGKHVSILGLTYKPGTDTLRRSLSIELCRWLHHQGAEVSAFDPAVRELPPELCAFISLSSDITDSVETAECIVVATEWPVFKNIDLDTITKMQKKIIIDPNGFLEGTLENLKNVKYFAVGRSAL